MSIGPTEIILVLAIALLVFGPSRLPQMGRQLGRGLREFKKAANTAKEELGLGEVLDDVNKIKGDIASSVGVAEIRESIAGVTSTIDDVKASVGVDEIAAGLGSAKAAMTFNPTKAAKGLATGRSILGNSKAGTQPPSAASAYPEADMQTASRGSEPVSREGVAEEATMLIAPVAPEL